MKIDPMTIKEAPAGDIQCRRCLAVIESKRRQAEARFALFEHMQNEHDISLLESEMNEIVSLAHAIKI